MAVVEERDVPVGVEALEEPQQRPGTLGEVEPEDQLVLQPGRVAARQVPDVGLGGLVVAQVRDAEAVAGQALYQLALLPWPLPQRDANEDLRHLRVRVTVVESRDHAPVQAPDETPVAAWPLRHAHG